jgi:pyruvyltransferase
LKLFWWSTTPNLGDALSRTVLNGHGYDVEWAPPQEAEWVSIGSVLGWFNGFKGVVFGSGRSGKNLPPIDLSRADVRALRGMITRELVKGGDTAVLGDPGLLVSDFVKHDPQGYVAIVPHWKDQERMKAQYSEAVFVDVRQAPEKTLPLIAGAERVISSSLHGLVLADAFGIPRQWEWFDGVQGDGLKFRDYSTVVGSFEPGEWVVANHSSVEVTRSELRACLV